MMMRRADLEGPFSGGGAVTFVERMCSGSPMRSRPLAPIAMRASSSGSQGSSGASVAYASMPASRKARTAARRSSMDAHKGSYSFRIRSRLVVMEKLTRRMVRAATARSRSRSRKDHRPAGLQDEYLWRRGGHRLENTRHHLFLGFGRLIRIDQRRAINPLPGLQFAEQQIRRICFKRGELSPAPPILGLQAPVNSHGRNVAVGASKSAVPRRASASG